MGVTVYLEMYRISFVTLLRFRNKSEIIKDLEKKIIFYITSYQEMSGFVQDQDKHDLGAPARIWSILRRYDFTLRKKIYP